jgi:hypothetical protein
MMNKLHVRFHLAAGINYKQWQIRDKNSGGVSYYDPTENCLVLSNCTLRNMPGTAKRVFESQVRDVSGWIECDSVTIVPAHTPMTQELIEATYDPKIRPYWYCPSTDNILDNARFARIITQGRRVFIHKR